MEAIQASFVFATASKSFHKTGTKKHAMSLFLPHNDQITCKWAVTLCGLQEMPKRGLGFIIILIMQNEGQVWTEEMDQALIQIRQAQQVGHWGQVVKQMARQYNITVHSTIECQKRYENHLRPQQGIKSLTQQEWQEVKDLHVQVGNKWHILAARLKRPAIKVRNFFNCRLKTTLIKMRQLAYYLINDNVPPLKHEHLLQSSEEYLLQADKDARTLARTSFELKNRLMDFSSEIIQGPEQPEPNFRNRLADLITELRDHIQALENEETFLQLKTRLARIRKKASGQKAYRKKPKKTMVQRVPKKENKPKPKRVPKKSVKPKPKRVPRKAGQSKPKKTSLPRPKKTRQPKKKRQPKPKRTSQPKPKRAPKKAREPKRRRIAVAPWTTQEDDALRELKEVQEIGNWQQIANLLDRQYNLKVRSPEQCQRRYEDFVSSRRTTGKMNDKEWKKLVEAHQKVGSRWTSLSEEFERSSTDLSNQFNRRVDRTISWMNRMASTMKSPVKKGISKKVLGALLRNSEWHARKPGNKAYPLAEESFSLKNRLLDLSLFRWQKGRGIPQSIRSEAVGFIRDVNQHYERLALSLQIVASDNTIQANRQAQRNIVQGQLEIQEAMIMQDEEENLPSPQQLQVLGRSESRSVLRSSDHLMLAQPPMAPDSQEIQPPQILPILQMAPQSVLDQSSNFRNRPAYCTRARHSISSKPPSPQ